MGTSRNRLALRVGSWRESVGSAPPARLAVSRTRVSWAVRPGGTVRSRVESVTASAGVRLESEAARAIDAVFATPLPEAVTRSLIERRVVERIVAETLASGHMETMVADAADDERTEQLVKQVLDSPAMQRLLADALDSQLTVELTDRLVQNPQLQRVVEDAVRAGLARRTATLVDTMASGAHHLDRVLERAPRRWLRRPPRPPPLPDREPAVPYAGLGSRAAAFLVDSAIVHFGYLIGCAMFILVAYLVGWSPSRLLADGLAGVGWTIVVATYFVSFWTAAGQTPGMRLLRLKLTAADGAPTEAPVARSSAYSAVLWRLQ